MIGNDRRDAFVDSRRLGALLIPVRAMRIAVNQVAYVSLHHIETVYGGVGSAGYVSRKQCNVYAFLPT